MSVASKLKNACTIWRATGVLLQYALTHPDLIFHRMVRINALSISHSLVGGKSKLVNDSRARLAMSRSRAYELCPSVLKPVKDFKRILENASIRLQIIDVHMMSRVEHPECVTNVLYTVF